MKKTDHTLEIEARREPHQQAEVRKYEHIYFTDPKYRMGKWRRSALAEYLRGIHDCRSVLDVGCGRGESSHMVDKFGNGLSHGNWRGCEVVPLLCGDRRVELVPGAHDLSFYRDDSFDLVLSCDVLEHIPEQDIPASLAEMVRVARSRIYLTISHKPAGSAEMPLHVTLHPREWWVQRIKQALKDAGYDARRVRDLKTDIPEAKKPCSALEVVLEVTNPEGDKA